MSVKNGKPASYRRKQMFAILDKNPELTKTQLKKAMKDSHNVSVMSGKVAEAWSDWHGAQRTKLEAEKPVAESGEPVAAPRQRRHRRSTASLIEPQHNTLVPQKILDTIGSVKDAITVCGNMDNALKVAAAIEQVGSMDNFAAIVALIKLANNEEVIDGDDEEPTRPSLAAVPKTQVI